jgi:hypothetical protein
MGLDIESHDLSADEKPKDSGRDRGTNDRHDRFALT